MSYEININRYFDYQDISTLIHEFFHYINRNVVKTINYKFLGEFISIYFEEYAKRYLMNKRNLTSEDVSLNERIVKTLVMNNTFNSYCIVLLAYEKLGNISSSTVNELKNILQYTDNSFEKECLDIVDIIENKGTDALYNNWMFLYKYIIGTILAYYVLEHCQLEDMIKLNDLMNNECSFNMSIYEILNTIGIKINNDLVYESFDIMKKILNKNRLTK
jgi:hypothetical protein